MVRDRKQAFMGSQSLRELELDGRREIGIIFRDAKVIAKLIEIFDQDWQKGAVSKPAAEDATTGAPAKAAKHVARSIAKKLPPVAPIMEQALVEAGKISSEPDLDFKKVEITVKEAVKDAVKEAVQSIVEDAVEVTRA